jgi:hypothetical protein
VPCIMSYGCALVCCRASSTSLGRELRKRHANSNQQTVTTPLTFTDTAAVAQPMRVFSPHSIMLP